MHYAKIGAISSGTLVPHEIACNFAFDLRNLARDDTDELRKARVLAALAAYQTANAAGNDIELSRFIEEVAPELFEEYCAPYTSFRANVGDGSDFVISPDVDSLMEDARYNNGVVSVEDGAERPAQAADIDYVVVVNDHGNVTLYDAHTRKEIWACV